MKYYKSETNQVFAYESDGSQDAHIKPGLRPMTTGEVQKHIKPPESAAQMQQRLTAALNDHLNQVAGQRSYDDRFTCSLRAGYPGPFQAEGQTFAAWMDDCNMVAYQILAEVKQGLRPIPTEAELIAALPVIEWPPSPVPEGAA